MRVPRETAFDAWLDPRMARRFLAPRASSVANFENEPREGGGFRLVMQDEARRVEHEGLPDIERADRHKNGWSSILEKLSQLLRREPPSEG